MRRNPVLVGDPQLGSTCALSAQTGLPALTIPAGYTAEGLPVGIELLGRPFADVRLVSLGYAFESLGSRRRPPFATPPLVNGRAPAPSVSFTTTARDTPRSGSVAVARAQFTFDRARSTLRYDVAVRGVPADQVQAVVLRRHDGTSRARVVHVLAGPATLSAAGSTTLTAVNREALSNGQLGLYLARVDAAAVEARLVMPR